MINFISRDEKRHEIVEKVRRKVMTVTLVVLVGYGVVAAGVVGWFVLWQVKQQRTVVEVEGLMRQIGEYAGVEVGVRRLAVVVKTVEEFLVGRGDASGAALVIPREGYNFPHWEYAASGDQKLTVAASSPAQINDYVEYLKQYYTLVQPDKVKWSPDGGWSGELLIGGKKKT